MGNAKLYFAIEADLRGDASRARLYRQDAEHLLRWADLVREGA